MTTDLAVPENSTEREGDTKRNGLLAQLARLAGIDFHVLQTLLLRGWSIIAGVVMVVALPHWFSAEEQGYYYTFLSLIAVQILFELGINQIIVQLVSHEAAHLRQSPDGTLTGPRRSIDRLASLVSLITRWYRIAAIAFFVGAGVGGLLFFGFERRLSGATVPVSWLALVLFTSVNLYLSPSLAVLEGFGRVGNVARVRLTQSIIGYLATWAALALGAGLLATPALAAVSVACTAYWLRQHDKRVRWLRRIRTDDAVEVMTWRHDVFPLQWRVALSWISGYLILQLLVPAAFLHLGPVMAGRLGLTLTIFNSLLSVGLSWVNARTPAVASFIALGERAPARAVFRGVALRSVGATALGCVAVSAGSLFLPQIIRDRLADLPVLGCLSAAITINCLIYALASFVRAHKEEPFVLQSVIAACLMAPAIFVASFFSLLAIAATFAAILAFVALPWVASICLRYYRRRA